MSRKVFNLVVSLILILMTACNPARMKLTANDNGKQVEVKAGAELRITLEANLSTGYAWEAQGLDSALFAQVGDPEYKVFSPGLVGSGGKQVFTFKALQAGTGTLTLVYHRSWETGVAPLDTFSVTVTVK
jgi:inhibitor of cysteine peptidase